MSEYVKLVTSLIHLMTDATKASVGIVQYNVKFVLDTSDSTRDTVIGAGDLPGLIGEHIDDDACDVSRAPWKNAAHVRRIFTRCTCR